MKVNIDLYKSILTIALSLKNVHIIGNHYVTMIMYGASTFKTELRFIGTSNSHKSLFSQKNYPRRRRALYLTFLALPTVARTLVN